MEVTMDDWDDLKEPTEVPAEVADAASPFTVAEKSPTWGDANTSIDIIAQNMKMMVKKIQDLRRLGIEDKGLPLPKICVVGDQSAGKSSLIEGMSEIKVPRSTGCCTRCPLEINLSESDAPWACRVLLTKKYMYDNSARAKRAKNPKGLGPWIDQDPEDILFANVTDKNELREILQNAQLATLNPGKDPEDFLNGEETDTQVKFSPNVVRLDISAPGFPNLSFYDLPGVINVAEVEDEKYLVPLVRNLVKEYIKAENCIVLLTMPMTDDATNSSAAGIIREIPGAIDRTMGVLTKPDRIQWEEGYDQWEEILSGDKFSIGHGYYVVRNNHDPRVDHAQAREEELHFFSKPPWTTELGGYHDRFGMRHLQNALSQLLLCQIKESLPGIVQQIANQAATVDAELQTLPEPPTENIPFIICDKLHTYNSRIKYHIDGGLRDYPFLKQWSQIAADFQKYLANSRPALVLGEKDPVWKRPPGFAPVGDDADCQMVSVQPSPKRKRTVNGAANSTTGENEAKQEMPKPSPAPTLQAASGNKGFLTEYFSQFDMPASKFCLEEIHSIHEDTYQSGVPGLGNPQAVETMNRMAVKHWKAPMETFLSITYEEIHNILVAELEDVFADYCRTNLYRELCVILANFIDVTRDEHLLDATEKYDIECLKPFTMATATFQRSQKETLALLKSRRHCRRKELYAAEVANLTEKAADPSKVSDADMGPDPFEKEIEIMAAVRAYYEIASARFVDTICQSIHTKLFFKCRNDLKEVIQSQLGIVSANAAERCQELMIEDNEREARRRKLKRDKERLEKAQESLRETTGY